MIVARQKMRAVVGEKKKFIPMYIAKESGVTSTQIGDAQDFTTVGEALERIEELGYQNFEVVTLKRRSTK